MIGGRRQLAAVIKEAIVTVDERYDGYREDLAKAMIAAVEAQQSSATESKRRDRIQQIVQTLGATVAE